MSEQDAKTSDLIEVLKMSGRLRKDWGPLLGSILFVRAMGVVGGRRSFWWTAWIGLGTVIGGIISKYVAHHFSG